MEILASQLTGLMDMKVFYKGKNAGKAVSPSLSLSPDLVSRKGLQMGNPRSEQDLAVCLSVVTTTCTLFNFFLMAS